MHNRPIKVLWCSDWGDTGFGTVTMEVCKRLAEMECFEVHVHGWHAMPANIDGAKEHGIHLQLTKFYDVNDQFGQQTFDAYVKAIEPDIVITLGDPWMIEHVIRCPHRDAFTWIAYVPIDRDVLSKPWIDILKKPDVVVTYSKWGMDIVESQVPFRHPELILHGIDKTVFKPFYPEGMDETTPLDEVMKQRKMMVLGPNFADKFIVGFVGRNQIRKAIPRLMKAFKAFNCATWIERQTVNIQTEDDTKSFTAEEFCRDKQCFRCDVCPVFQQRPEATNTIIYLHTTRGNCNDGQDRAGVGWRIDEMALRLQLHDRVAITPGITALKGVSREALASIMNCFDVQCFMSHSEGFGLPIAEAISCGVPTFVTDYSSMPELVEEGGGGPIKVHDFNTFVTWENELASADIGHAADCIDSVFSDPEHAAQLREDAANNNYTPDWHDVALQFRFLFLRAAGREVN